MKRNYKTEKQAVILFSHDIETIEYIEEAGYMYKTTAIPQRLIKNLLCWEKIKHVTQENNVYQAKTAEIYNAIIDADAKFTEVLLDVNLPLSEV